MASGTRKEHPLNIVIHKPWYGTNLAWFIYMLLFIGSVTGYIRWRLWRLKKEKIFLETQVHVRTLQIEEQKEEIISQRDLVEQQNQTINRARSAEEPVFSPMFPMSSARLCPLSRARWKSYWMIQREMKKNEENSIWSVGM